MDMKYFWDHGPSLPWLWPWRYMTMLTRFLLLY